MSADREAAFDFRDSIESVELSSLEALKSNPDSWKAWRNLGVVASRRGHVEAAIAMTEKSILSDRKGAEAVSYCNLGNLLYRAGKHGEALGAFEEARKRGLDDWRLYINLGVFNLSLGDPEKALTHLSKAFETAPDEVAPSIIMDMGYASLMVGNLKAGFNILQPFWSTPCKEIHDLGIPIWDFKSQPSPKNLKILVGHNQGAGDTIQFARFLPQLIEAVRSEGGEVVLGVPRSLLDLFNNTDSPLCVSLDIRHVSSPPWDTFFDYYLPTSLLPLWAGATLDNLPKPPYLKLPADRVRIQREGSLKVGLVWAARQEQETGIRRSIPLRSLLPLTAIPGVKVYGLQVGEPARDIQDLGAEYLIESLSPQITNFLNLAYAMQEMDVVVSADTGPLHLAGAIGIHCIGLLSRDAADWRWLQHVRRDSPWYPEMILYRQQKVGDWSYPVSEVTNYLRRWASDLRRDIVDTVVCND